MHPSLPVLLTSKDFALLENLMQQWGEPFAGAAEIIRRKLSNATLVFPADAPPDVVTLNSRVRFRVGSGHSEERVLVAGPSEEVYGMTLLLASPRGLALIGASAGQTVEAIRRDGEVEQIFIEAVLYQPEQARPRPALQVVNGGVSDSTLRPAAVKKPAPPRYFGGDDDPGPSAA